MAIAPERPQERHAIGLPMKRKEDPRLIQGRGRYRRRHRAAQHAVHGARAQPYPHARIVKIDKTRRARDARREGRAHG